MSRNRTFSTASIVVTPEKVFPRRLETESISGLDTSPTYDASTRTRGEDPLSAIPGNASRKTSEVFSLFDVRDTLSVASTRNPIDGVMVQPRPTEASGERNPNGGATVPRVEAPPNGVFPSGGAVDKPGAALGGVKPGIWAIANVEITNIKLAITAYKGACAERPDEGADEA